MHETLKPIAAATEALPTLRRDSKKLAAECARALQLRDPALLLLRFAIGRRGAELVRIDCAKPQPNYRTTTTTVSKSERWLMDTAPRCENSGPQGRSRTVKAQDQCQSSLVPQQQRLSANLGRSVRESNTLKAALLRK